MNALGKIYNVASIVTMNSNGKLNGITVAWDYKSIYKTTDDSNIYWKTKIFI